MLEDHMEKYAKTNLKRTEECTIINKHTNTEHTPRPDVKFSTNS